ncbi:MAG: YkgJ family cysteine cluster protein [Candidatus Portnoybacteria bacterium]|nr:YkgJ family cysteine cluster protein [Candidatus Portnoybacteria bacterium]
MKIKTLLGRKECAGCDDFCCKFEKSGRDAAPIFLPEERALVSREADGQGFLKPFKKTDASQIVLRKGGEKEYFCPFFMKEKRLCSIQEKKPFDCLFFPFAFMRGKKGGVYIACFNKKICPGLAKLKEGQFEKYVEYL